LALEELTTLDTPALNAADPELDDELPPPPLLPLLLLLQALITRAATAPSAVATKVLRLFMP
jgi:hypothetical protein